MHSLDVWDAIHVDATLVDVRVIETRSLATFTQRYFRSLAKESKSNLSRPSHILSMNYSQLKVKCISVSTLVT